MKKAITYVGLDVHKETIAVALAESGGGDVGFFGTIANEPQVVRKMAKWLSRGGRILRFCYEAGP